jgi:hypothetical protein
MQNLDIRNDEKSLHNSTFKSMKRSQKVIGQNDEIGQFGSKKWGDRKRERIRLPTNCEEARRVTCWPIGENERQWKRAKRLKGSRPTCCTLSFPLQKWHLFMNTPKKVTYDWRLVWKIIISPSDIFFIVRGRETGVHCSKTLLKVLFGVEWPERDWTPNVLYSKVTVWLRIQPKNSKQHR